MSFAIELSGRSSELRANYFPPIILNGNYELALVSLQAWNSVANISSENNKFYYIDDENKEKVLEIPEGAYEVSQIQEYLQRALKPEHVKKPLVQPDQKFELEDQPIILVGNQATFKTEIVCRYRIDFSKPQNIGSLLGFKNDRICEAFVRCHGDEIIQILSVESVNIECSIISNSYYNDSRSQILHKLSILEPPGYKISDTPQNLLYLPVTVSEISEICLRLTDERGKLVDFRNEFICIRLHLRKIA